MRGVIRGVGFSGEMVKSGEGEKVEGMEVEGEGEEKENDDPEKKGRQPSVVEEVLRVCSEQGLEEEMMSVCKVGFCSFFFLPLLRP